MNLTSESYFNQKKRKILFLIFIFISTLIPTILAIIYAPINCDSSYFLSIVNRISEGYIPYKDLSLGYTPLVFYLLLPFKYLFSFFDSYELYLTIHFIFEYLCAILIYKIGYRFTKSYYLSILAAWLFFIKAFQFQGDVFLLEIPSLFFGLLACELALKYSTKSIHFVFIGIIASLSFWAKQFGIGFFPLIILLLFFFGTSKWKQISIFIIGYIFTFMLCALFWSDCFHSIIGGYGVDEIAKNHYKSDVLRSIPWAIITFTKNMFPNLIFAFYIPIILKFDKERWGKFIFLTAGIFGYILQFYFNNGPHYFLYIIPFGSLLTVILFQELNNNNRIVKYLYWVVFSYVLILSVYNTYIINKEYLNSEKKKSQYILADKLNKLIENKKSSLYIYNADLVQQYFLTNYVPPSNNGRIDYSFGPLVVNEQIHLKKIESADYILKFSYDNKWEKNYENIELLLKTYKSIIISDNIKLYHNTHNYKSTTK